jgi:hypothetical protein
MGGDSQQRLHLFLEFLLLLPALVADGALQGLFRRIYGRNLSHVIWAGGDRRQSQLLALRCPGGRPSDGDTEELPSSAGLNTCASQASIITDCRTPLYSSLSKKTE